MDRMKALLIFVCIVTIQVAWWGGIMLCQGFSHGFAFMIGAYALLLFALNIQYVEVQNVGSKTN